MEKNTLGSIKQLFLNLFMNRYSCAGQDMVGKIAEEALLEPSRDCSPEATVVTLSILNGTTRVTQGTGSDTAGPASPTADR